MACSGLTHSSKGIFWVFTSRYYSNYFSYRIKYSTPRHRHSSYDMTFRKSTAGIVRFKGHGIQQQSSDNRSMPSCHSDPAGLFYDRARLPTVPGGEVRCFLNCGQQVAYSGFKIRIHDSGSLFRPVSTSTSTGQMKAKFMGSKVLGKKSAMLALSVDLCMARYYERL